MTGYRDERAQNYEGPSQRALRESRMIRKNEVETISAGNETKHQKVVFLSINDNSWSTKNNLFINFRIVFFHMMTVLTLCYPYPILLLLI